MTSRTTRGTLTRGIGISIGILSLLALASTTSSAQDRFPPRPTRPGDTSRAGTDPTQGSAAPRGVPNTNTNANTNTNTNSDASSKMEREDFGVAPTRALHNGPMHGPTPTSIPGGQVITTAGVLDMQRRGIPHVLVDVLGAPNMLPNAIPGAWLSQPGSFTDETQKRGTAMLMGATQGRKDTPLVFYCQSPQCWMSYNAALRAVNAGFTNVLWYRGGVEAWSRNAGR